MALGSPMLLAYKDGKVTAKAELLFVELFHSLLSLDDKLNVPPKSKELK